MAPLSSGSFIFITVFIVPSSPTPRLRLFMKLERDLRGEKGSRKGRIWLGSSKEKDSEVGELQEERKDRQEEWGREKGEGPESRERRMGEG